ncbi:hypothetical protein HYH03_011049 [Edaphochlamys debaryana]|uniref:Uncharacterized protein n=1 Tax=Edaphochlamys debaryana TaxID=47281 RepID=A0A836BVH9_9CHLO|nr:hypothetical protein HYH03_011049 [Edaphochlamys debaryana]|eukprot:KAG2490661.1 hypothetical protein HYH03_011049 [Edaphochlamys debaryana]
MRAFAASPARALAPVDPNAASRVCVAATTAFGAADKAATAPLPQQPALLKELEPLLAKDGDLYKHVVEELARVQARGRGAHVRSGRLLSARVLRAVQTLGDLLNGTVFIANTEVACTTEEKNAVALLEALVAYQPILNGNAPSLDQAARVLAWSRLVALPWRLSWPSQRFTTPGHLSRLAHGMQAFLRNLFTWHPLRLSSMPPRHPSRGPHHAYHD